MVPVAVVVVNYNTQAHLRECLISAAREQPSQLIVVDNCSNDGSAAMVRTEFPGVTLQANTTNPGYGAAANQGIAMSHETYVLLLNADTRLEPGVLRTVAAYLDEHSGVALVGPRITGADGALQPSCFSFPTPWQQLLELANVKRLVTPIPWLRDRYLPTWSHEKARAVPWVMGAALGIRCTAFQAVGGFDPAYFMYCEETDLAYRFWASDWEVHFFPDAHVMHAGAASTSQRRAEMALRLHASTRRFYDSHYSAGARWMLQLVLVLAMAARTLRDTVRLRWASDAGRRSRLMEDRRIWLSVMRNVGLRP